MDTKYTGRELHMLKTLRQIYLLLENYPVTGPETAAFLAAPFSITGPTDTELEKLIAADRAAKGWPVQGA